MTATMKAAVVRAPMDFGVEDVPVPEAPAGGLLLDVKTDVWEQRVMLTGTLDDPKVKADVVQLVKQADPRVKKIYDEVQIVSKEEKEQRREAAKNKDENKKEGVGNQDQCAVALDPRCHLCQLPVAVGPRRRVPHRPVPERGRTQDRPGHCAQDRRGDRGQALCRD